VDEVTGRMLEHLEHLERATPAPARGMRAWSANPLLKEVTREDTAGELRTGVYLPHELEAMVAIKNAGATEHELAFLHELKAEFAGTFEQPGRSGVVAIVDERAHYEQRNTSMVRVVARYEPDAQDSHDTRTAVPADEQQGLFQMRGEREPRE
jgi:hypothetical protein